MTLVQLRYLLAVAEFRSVSDAAAALFVTQPAITNAVRELEREFGITIFRRSGRGMEITSEGSEFLGYARNVADQADLLHDRYRQGGSSQVRFVVSSQHYSFAVSAFIRLIRTFGMEKYDFCLRETRTRDIIEDVRSLSANMGILFLSDRNRRTLSRLFREAELLFCPLASFAPHVFVAASCPLASQQSVTMEDLAGMPFICFEQGSYASDSFSEELIPNPAGTRIIRVSDRATLFNLLLGMNGYTVASGVISGILNPEIASVPLDAQETMEIGILRRRGVGSGLLCERYEEYLREELVRG